MTANLFLPDGRPDFDAIIEHFPEHGGGEITHRSANGHQFRFNIQRNHQGTYDAVILDQPSYGGRPEGAHETHRLPAPNGFAKVCFKTPARDLPSAVAVALHWAECTSAYIRNGGSFR